MTQRRVAILGNVRPGERHNVVIGGKRGEMGAQPLSLEVNVVSRSHGLFVPETAGTGFLMFLASR